MKRTVLSILILTACASFLSAQELTFRTSVSVLTDQRELSSVTQSFLYPSFDLKLGWKLPRDAEFNALYGHPVGGIGISYLHLDGMEFPGSSRMGSGASLYGFFTAPIVRSEVFSFEYTVECGLAALTHPYHPSSNSQNHAYGGNPLYYLGGGLAAMFRIWDGLSAGVEAGFRHVSSGCWIVPNRGLTSLAPAVNLKYTFSETTRDCRRFDIGDAIPEKPFRWGVSVGAGGHISDGERRMNEVLYKPADRPERFHRFLNANVGVEAFWRYARCFATGLGAEFFYAGEAGELAAVDQALYGESDPVYSPWAGGVILLQEIYYRRFAVHGGVGVNFARHMGIFEDGGLLYQKLGLRYYTPGLDGAFFGFGVRLHNWVQSDYMEFSVGKHF